MARKKKPVEPEYFLRIRSYPEGEFVTVWLVRVDGPAQFALLWGELLPALAEELAKVIGLPVERDECQLPGCLPVQTSDCVAVGKQKTLFGFE